VLLTALFLFTLEKHSKPPRHLEHINVKKHPSM
jgi:hypothetical protein